MQRILIIEDDERTLNNLALMLDMEGFKTFVADNGRDGVELALREIPDLIICDVMMPELDGHGVLAELRQDRRTQAVPFVFLTARVGRDDLRTGMNLGADDYITKPASGDEVLAAVRARLARCGQQERGTLDRVEVKPDFTSWEPLQIQLALTPREAEVLLWIAQGKSNGDIATILGNSENTVKVHVARILEKLGVESRLAASTRAIEVLTIARV